MGRKIYKSTSFFILLWIIPTCICSRNLALRRTVWADSEHPGYPTWTAERAVDGDRNQNIYCGSCLHTYTYQVNSTVAFLTIDLGERSSIIRVEIYYRQPYDAPCRNNNVINSGTKRHHFRFKGYSIEISNDTVKTTCYQDTSIPYPDLYQNNTCIGTGRYLSVVQKNKGTAESEIGGPILELCEVEVYGCPVGRYGDNCSEFCSNCKEEMCDPDNGVCESGCKDVSVVETHIQVEKEISDKDGNKDNLIRILACIIGVLSLTTIVLATILVVLYKRMVILKKEENYVQHEVRNTDENSLYADIKDVSATPIGKEDRRPRTGAFHITNVLYSR